MSGYKAYDPNCMCERCMSSRNKGLDTIQNHCQGGWVLPDRCRYTGRLGCDCGAYPPIKDKVNDL